MQLILLIICALTAKVFSLECIQCDMHSVWYAEDDHEKHVAACQAGLIQPTPCRNQTHTHCIVSWFRSGGNAERTVTERKCGPVDEVTGCTLYNSKLSRRVRHLLSQDNQREVRRDSASTFVEVCSESCPFGDCINSGPSQKMSLLLTLMMVLLVR